MPMSIVNPTSKVLKRKFEKIKETPKMENIVTTSFLCMFMFLYCRQTIPDRLEFGPIYHGFYVDTCFLF